MRLTKWSVLVLAALLTLPVSAELAQNLPAKKKPAFYTAFNLGTLGGYYAEAYGINNFGWVGNVELDRRCAASWRPVAAGGVDRRRRVGGATQHHAVCAKRTGPGDGICGHFRERPSGRGFLRIRHLPPMLRLPLVAGLHGRAPRAGREQQHRN